MSLATRLSAFFLIALALVLGGFSGTLYVLARVYLTRQLDERLQLALDTLEASVDIEPGGLEWEPTDRQMTLGVERGVTAVRWAVRDGRGQLVDRSANAQPGDFPADWSPKAWPETPPDGTAFGRGEGWRLAGRRLRIEELLRQGRGHPNDEPGFEIQYPVLVLVVGMAPAPVEATLSRLGLALAGLSGAVWISAAALGRWLCLRALAPVSRLARAASTLTAADPGWRLPALGTSDELDELGRTFNDLLDRLHAAFEQQRRFAGDASHQLRNPLAALLGQVQVARRRERSPEEYRRILDKVEVEGTRLRQIVESLLLLIQPAEARPSAPLLDLTQWIPGQLGRWSSHPRFADMSATFDESAALVVRIHPPLLAQLLDNLLENACKYSDPGTPIVVKAWREAEAVAMGVEDRGRGLTDEDRMRVFEPFYRADRVREAGYEGIGLGLAVAQRIASTAGGTLAVQGNAGDGSLFVLRLPAVEQPEPAQMLDRSPSDSLSDGTYPDAMTGAPSP